MSYTVNKTNGSVLTIVGDGTVDATSTDITLVGRKYSGYGEVLNENNIKLLENFANRTAPNSPLEGQVWYDTLEGRLKVYTGSVFKPTGGPLVQDTEPSGLVIGDLWINNESNQLYFYDGVDLSLAGPIYSNAEGKHGWIVENVVDTGNNGRSITGLWVNGQRVGILSRYEFTPQTAINGFASIKVGINFSTAVTGLKLHGTATSADAVAGIAPGQFLRSDESDITTGTLGVLNDGGLTLGSSSNFTQFVSSTVTTFKNNLQDRDWLLQVNSSVTGGLTNVIDIDTSTLTMKIFEGRETSNVVMGGDLTIDGDLIVSGDTTTINVATMRVEDKNIELAYGGTPTDTLANGGGITLKGTTDHTINWANSTTNWTTSDNFGVASGKYFHVNDVSVLSNDTLGAGVVNSSLTNVGTLTELQVDSLELNGNTISTITTNTDLNIDVHGTGNVVFDNEESTPVTQIKGVADPSLAQDVATKNYVDTEITNQDIIITMNVTGMATQNTVEIPAELAKLAPPVNYQVGTRARILCETLSLAGTPTTITTNTGTTTGLTNELLVNQVAVDKDASLSSASVVQSLSFPNGITPSGNSIAVARTTKLFEIQAGPLRWAYVSDV
jgi:hypothetical protein|tara:strand:+ start:1632 stop:3470 length:1839 start_codon:yes stop_codon:yes gene_type:complete